MITSDQLQLLMPFARWRVPVFYGPLVSTMNRFDITTPLRQAAFLAQLAHESGELRYVRELASGSAYEGRKDLGNTEPGDGVRFKGRGLIQITGRSNYRDCGAALGVPLEDQPELLEQPENACASAGWFWDRHRLNEPADAQNIHTITRRINGGLNGIGDRIRYYSKAKKILGVAHEVVN